MCNTPCKRESSVNDHDGPKLESDWLSPTAKQYIGPNIVLFQYIAPPVSLPLDRFILSTGSTLTV